MYFLLYDFIKNYRLEDNRVLSENFIKLPTKRANPDYYNVVKEPIDLIKIQQKIKSNDYTKFQDFENDIYLLISNAFFLFSN